MASLVEAPDLFFVAADALGEDFDGSAQVGDLRGESREGAGVATSAAVVVNEGSQVRVPVEASAADASPAGDGGEREWLAVV
jgi:hypothetical protein